MKHLHVGRKARAALGALLLLGLMLPTPRALLESGMRLHMLVQYPALMLAGALLAQAVPSSLGRGLSGWNELGITGLGAGALILSVLMIPRVLDLALVDGRVESVKFVALLFAGAALWSSWRDAGLVVQAFFLGGILPMTVMAGTLYSDSPLRLCNAYRLDDQQELGLALVWMAVAAGGMWLLAAGRRLLAPGPGGPGDDGAEAGA